MKVPTIQEVKDAVGVLKSFCDSRTTNAEEDCRLCPIRELCGTEPYTWKEEKI